MNRPMSPFLPATPLATTDQVYPKLNKSNRLCLRVHRRYELTFGGFRTSPVMPLMEELTLPINVSFADRNNMLGGDRMNSIIYLVGLVVVVLFILSVLGLR